MSVSNQHRYRDTKTGRRFIVVSGDMFNDVDSYATCMVMELVSHVDDDYTYPYFVELDDGTWVKIVSMRDWPKHRLEPDGPALNTDEISLVHTALFRIMSANGPRR